MQAVLHPLRFALKTNTSALLKAVQVMQRSAASTENGEVYLPSAIDLMARDKKVYAYEFEGKRYDLGSKSGSIEANIEYTLRNPASREKLIAYLEKLASNGYKV